MVLSIGSVLAGVAESKKEYQQADKKMNQLYATARKTLSKAEFKELQQDQRRWIEYRDYMLPNLGAGVKKEDSEEYWEMMAGLTKERNTYLNAWVSGSAKADDWVGSYVDSRGGEMKITKKNGKYFFEINVVRTRAHNIGQISGFLAVNQGKGRYSDAGKDHDDGGETWLDFEVMDYGKRIKVTGINTNMHHGKGAYFDGVYILLPAKK